MLFGLFFFFFFFSGLNSLVFFGFELTVFFVCFWFDWLGSLHVTFVAYGHSSRDSEDFSRGDLVESESERAWSIC